MQALVELSRAQGCYGSALGFTTTRKRCSGCVVYDECRRKVSSSFAALGVSGDRSDFLSPSASPPRVSPLHFEGRMTVNAGKAFARLLNKGLSVQALRDDLLAGRNPLRLDGAPKALYLAFQHFAGGHFRKLDYIETMMKLGNTRATARSEAAVAHDIIQFVLGRR